MELASTYPVLMVERVRETADFYVKHFGFEEAFTSDWYVSLRHGRRREFELAFVKSDHATIPEAFGAPSRGVLLNFEVEDAGAEYERLVGEAALELVQDLRDEDFGQRHFMLCDPAGNLIDVVQNTAPSAEYADGYGTAAKA